MKPILFSLLVILICGAASAASYYVAPPASGGSNSNPGTLSQPFATITKGVSMLSAAGDEIYVRAGTYNESVTVWHKYGTSTSPIRVQNYSGETPVIDGTGTSTDGVVLINESSHIRFDGFEVKSGPKMGILVYDADNVKVRWNEVHDCQRNGINASGALFDTTHDITIEGNTVEHCVLSNSARTLSGGWYQAVSAYKTRNVTIVNNWVHENYGEGIDYILSDYGTIANNTVYDNYSVDIYLDNARYTTVDSNFIPTGWSGVPSDYYRNGAPAIGIGAANETYSSQRPLTDLTISNNIVFGTKHGFYYGNYDYGHGLHYTTLANNTFYKTTSTMLCIEDGAGGTHVHDTTYVQNNIFYALTTQYSATAPTVGISYDHNNWYGGVSGHTIPGSGDVTSDPQLVNPSAESSVNDYKLQSTSPCKNAGTTVTAVTKDYWGTTRSSGSYDIGAHEY